MENPENPEEHINVRTSLIKSPFESQVQQEEEEKASNVADEREVVPEQKQQE